MGPHDNQPIAHAGAPLDGAAAVMIMVHGRNASPANILSLSAAIDRPQFACVAPAAAGGSWYPFSFMAPRAQNEPGISSALGVLDALVVDLMNRGFPSRKIVLLGFSQGACLSSEFSIRHPRRYGGVLVLSGGLIGAPGTTWDDVTASLDGTPVFLGCSDIDSHIPKERVIESEAVFARIGARVKRTLYPGMGHAVNDDEIAQVRIVLDEVLGAP
jgi:phospholipase/carboxylesterase/glyoxalase family protein